MLPPVELLYVNLVKQITYKVIPGTLNNEKGNGVRQPSIVLSSKETIWINIVLN